MPIANCIVTPKHQEQLDSVGNLIELWANESSISSENMTINIITSNEQHGKRYRIIATLLLPTIWSDSDVSSLQIGLAKALSIYFNALPDQILVCTSMINSGMVVESSEEVKW